MKKLFLLVCGIPLAAFVWWIYHSKTDARPVPFARVQRGTLISTLPTNGQVEPIQWEAVRVETAGVVEKVPVHEGQTVAKGAPLAIMAQSGLRADLDAAESRLAQVRADLATIEAGGKSSELVEIENQLAKARFDRDQAQREYASLQRLAEKQAATPVEVAAARSKVKQSELEIQALERRRAALVGKTDKAVVLARLKDAQAAVELARQRIAKTIVRAPLAGVVYKLAVRPGSYLNAGELVANVGQLDRLRVRVYVDEPELGRLQEGQPVTITWDALPGKRWQGIVEKLPTEIVPLGTRQVGVALCTIENPGHELVPGTNVNVEIRTNEAANTLTMPKEALRRDASGVGVFVLRGGTVVWQRVKTGASSLTRVEILEGLSEGDSVALPTERLLRDGERVRPVIHRY